MELDEIFIIIAYVSGAIVGVLVWESLLRKHFKK